MQAFERLRTAIRLREATRVGPRAKVVGRPYISDRGQLEIGADFHLQSSPALSHLVAMAGGTIRIGDRVHISHGAAISAQLEVSIGDDTEIGSYVVVMDSDFHAIGDRMVVPPPLAVQIGKRVVIGHRVTVLRGSSIGDDARIASGSVVSGHVAAGTSVAGVPARPLTERNSGAEGEGGVLTLAMKVFRLPAPPNPGDGPDSIPGWDSLGALKLVLAIEDSFGVTLSETELKNTRTLADLMAVLERARGAK